MPNYSHWDLLEEIRLEEAVCLWCEIEPYSSPRARRDQHPESVPVERFLLDAYKKGELPVKFGLGWGLKVRETGLPDDDEAFVQKADLRKLAEQKGVSPRFLFPDDSSVSAELERPGDNPPLYRSPYVDLALRAEEHFGERVRIIKAHEIRGWLMEEGPKIDPHWSQSKATHMATFLRHPDQQKGGAKKSRKV